MTKMALKRVPETRTVLVSLILCMAVSGCSAGGPTAGAPSSETTQSEITQGEATNTGTPQGEETLVESSAACAQARPVVEPSQAVPGETFRLYGEGFRNGCNDTPSPGVEPPPEPPERKIRIEMRQGAKTWDLGRADADEAYVLDVYLEVPPDAEPGQAVVVVRTGGGPPIETPLLVLAG